MIRFSAGEEEIACLLHFLARRMPGGIRMVPLKARDRDDLRFRHSPRPLIERLARDPSAAQAWGLRPGDDADASLIRLPAASPRSQSIAVDPEASRLIVLHLGPAQGPERRRDGLLEARDWTADSPDGPRLLPQSALARDLVQRGARHLRRRGQMLNGRWHLP